MASTALATAPGQIGAGRIYYIDEGMNLRAIHCVRGPDGRYRPTGIEERISFPLVQAAIARSLGRDDLHPTELGFAELGAGSFRKKIKHAAKKIAHSKLIKKIAKGVKMVAAFVPGASAVTASIDAGQAAAQGVKMAKRAVKGAKKVVHGAAKLAHGSTKHAHGKKGRSSLSGIPLDEIGAIKARLPARAVAQAGGMLRAHVKPTSAVAKSPQQAKLREARLHEASKALALVPDEHKAQAAKVLANRVDGYKVITPSGATVWVPKAVASAA